MIKNILATISILAALISTGCSQDKNKAEVVAHSVTIIDVAPPTTEKSFWTNADDFKTLIEFEDGSRDILIGKFGEAEDVFKVWEVKGSNDHNGIYTRPPSVYR